MEEVVTFGGYGAGRGGVQAGAELGKGLGWGGEGGRMKLSETG